MVSKIVSLITVLRTSNMLLETFKVLVKTMIIIQARLRPNYIHCRFYADSDLWGKTERVRSYGR